MQEIPVPRNSVSTRISGNGYNQTFPVPFQAKKEKCTFDEQTCFWILVPTCITVLVGCPRKKTVVMAYSGTCKWGCFYYSGCI